MATSQEKVIAFHISRLKDKRSDVRLGAIGELEALGAAAAPALDALKQCFEDSTEPEVKNAAQQAGYKIYLATKEA